MYYFEKTDDKWAGMKERIVDFFFPMSTYCIICGNMIDSTRTYPICDHCIRKVRWGHYSADFTNDPFFNDKKNTLDSANSCIKYGLYEKQLIVELKYSGKTYVARAIAKIMEDCILSDVDFAELFLNCDYLVPVPMSRDKIKTRGFNQTKKVADHLSKRLGISMIDCLERIKAAKEQKHVTGDERYLNMEGVFCLKEGYQKAIKGKKIIILDDVYTTGATALNCAKALKKEGAKEAHLLALASSNHFMLEKSEKNV